MNPGIARHREEWSRFWRRLSMLAAIASVVLAAPFVWLMRSPGLQRQPNDPKRFGFLGDEQYVRRIQLTTLGDPRGAKNDSRMIAEKALPKRKRGGGTPASLTDKGLTPARKTEQFRPPGPGDSEEEILARALLRAGSTPLFQSRELVIEQLVEPAYPVEAREKGIEGRVAIMALVDRKGTVRQAEIVGSAEHVLERAAMDAVLQCRFQPYTVDGEAREVYAMFRFAFPARELGFGQSNGFAAAHFVHGKTGALGIPVEEPAPHQVLVAMHPRGERCGHLLGTERTAAHGGRDQPRGQEASHMQRGCLGHAVRREQAVERRLQPGPECPVVRDESCVLEYRRRGAVLVRRRERLAPADANVELLPLDLANERDAFLRIAVPEHQPDVFDVEPLDRRPEVPRPGGIRVVPDDLTAARFDRVRETRVERALFLIAGDQFRHARGPVLQHLAGERDSAMEARRTDLEHRRAGSADVFVGRGRRDERQPHDARAGGQRERRNAQQLSDHDGGLL